MTYCSPFLFGNILYESHCIEVLNHASTHGYNSLADKAAPFTISKPLADVAKGLSFPGLVRKWVGTMMFYSLTDLLLYENMNYFP